MSDTRFYVRFLAAPKRILGDDTGHVRGLEVENTTLVPRNGGTKAQGLGTTDVLDVDTVIFCIGDQVDPNLGLPTRWGAYVTNPNPRFPVDGESYEAYDPETERPIEGVFVAGWARRPSTGLVGTARKDGTNGALALLQYLHTVEPLTAEELIRRLEQVRAHLQGLGKPIVTKEDWLLLERVEEEEAKRRGLPEFKFATNEEMLAAIARAREGALAEPMPPRYPSPASDVPAIGGTTPARCPRAPTLGALPLPTPQVGTRARATPRPASPRTGDR